MTDYISREAAMDILEDRMCRCAGVFGDIGGAVSGARLLIAKLPAADVREVKRGKWALVHYDDGYGGYDLYTHKECGCMQTRPRNFCHNCGAEMEAGDG